MKKQSSKPTATGRKKCLWCGKSFKPERHFHVCCSYNCTLAYKKAVQERLD